MDAQKTQEMFNEMLKEGLIDNLEIRISKHCPDDGGTVVEVKLFLFNECISSDYYRM